VTKQPTTDSEAAPTATDEPATTAAPSAIDLDADVITRIEDATSVDVTRYKTQELKQRFQQLFGIAHFLPWAGVGLGGSILALLVLWGVLFVPQATMAIAVLTFIYMALQGMFIGILAAALLVIARLFQQLTAIIDITLQTIRTAFSDIRQLGDPEVRAELAGGLVHGAIVPSIQSVISVKLGLLRAPISFVLNRILKKTASSLTESIERKMLSDDDSAPTEEPVDDVSRPANEATQRADDGDDTHLDSIQRRIEKVARTTRRATLIPAALVFIAAGSISSIPWIVAYLVLV